MGFLTFCYEQNLLANFDGAGVSLDTKCDATDSAMRSPSHRRRRSRSARKPRVSWFSNGSTPWPLLFWCGILYAIIGTILGSFAIPNWVWGVAVVGTVVQIVALAGPQALRRFRWLAANLLVLGSSLGAGFIAIALAIALNHAGTDQLNDISLNSVFWEVVRYGLVAVLLAAVAAGVTAALGDRLLRHFNQRQTMVILGVTALAGLGLGGIFGLLIYHS